MSHFIYKAKKSSGEIYKGERDANDRYELYKILKESGDEVIDVKEKSSNKVSIKGNFNFSFNIFGKVKSQEKINFARNLSSMITAGLSMSRALSVIERQSKNKFFQKIISSLQSEITKGKTLSDSMAMYRNVFSPLFISMVSAGEKSGTLNESLKIVADQLDKNYILQRKVKW
jgi:type IV pilus assembly protein PilC